MKKYKRQPVMASDGSEMIGMLNELTKGMWFEPMSKFSQIVYNADEIIPLIDYDDCVEFGTNNGQELLIFDEVNGRKHIRYSCSMTTIFDELVLQNVWDKNGQVYEYDFDAIYDELAKKHNFNGSVKASRKSASKKAIKASEDSDDIVMYWDGQKVYEGPIMRDFVDKVNWFLDDLEKLQEIVDYCNSFGDPLIEDTSDTFDVASTFAEVVGWEQGEAEAIDDDFYVSDEAGHFEIFPKSREVQGSVQRRAKKPVKASNNKRGGNAMKMYRGKRNVNASNRPAPRRSIKADEYYPENYADMGYEGLDDAITAMEALMVNLEDLKQVVSDYANQFEQWQSESDRGYRIDATPMEEMFSGPDDAYYFAEKVGEIADTVAQCERDFYDLT